MAFVDIPGFEDPVEGVWQVRPEQGAAALGMTHANWQHSILSTREREAARHRIAELNGCITCQNWRVGGFEDVGVNEAFYAGISDYRNNPAYSAREKLAIEMAERFSLAWTEVDEDFMEKMRASFSDAEIIDLLLCIGQYVAQGRLLHILQLDTVCPAAPASLAVARAEAASG